jgi:hypothetical protein
VSLKIDKEKMNKLYALEKYGVPRTHLECLMWFDVNKGKVVDVDTLKGKRVPGRMPDSKIVNQMIIAMDYGKHKTHVDLGIVLFADKDTYPVTIEKNDSNKKIHFRKMHPENDIELELEEMKKIIG